MSSPIETIQQRSFFHQLPRKITDQIKRGVCNGYVINGPFNVIKDRLQESTMKGFFGIQTLGSDFFSSKHVGDLFNVFDGPTHHPMAAVICRNTKIQTRRYRICLIYN